MQRELTPEQREWARKEAEEYVVNPHVAGYGHLQLTRVLADDITSHFDISWDTPEWVKEEASQLLREARRKLQ